VKLLLVRLDRTPFVTQRLRICWMAVLTFALFKNFSGIHP
jgi:hypothetical protein